MDRELGSSYPDQIEKVQEQPDYGVEQVQAAAARRITQGQSRTANLEGDFRVDGVNGSHGSVGDLGKSHVVLAARQGQ